MITIPIKPVSMSAVQTSPASGDAVARKLQIKVLRFNPATPDVAPHWQTYELVDAPGMTLFIALTEIRDKLDPSLQFDFVCRAGSCGSCAMLVNGSPALACRVLTKKLDAVITLENMAVTTPQVRMSWPVRYRPLMGVLGRSQVWLKRSGVWLRPYSSPCA